MELSKCKRKDEGIEALAMVEERETVHLAPAHDLCLSSDDSFPPPGGDDFFRCIFETIPAAVYTTDRDGFITFYNDAAALLWGRRPALRKERWCGSWRLFSTDGTVMAHEDCPMAMTLRSGEPVTGRTAIAERPDGSRYYFSPHPALLYDRAGEVIGGVNLLVDVTEIRRGEEAAQRLAAIVESSDDAIISKDLNGIIASWNEGARRLFGYTVDEVIGKSVLILIPEDRQDEEPRILEQLRRGERIDHYETVRRAKDGTLIPISLSVSPVKTQDGRIIGASKIARDITERIRADEARRAEIEERRKAEQAKELLLHELKHRVKNTLGTVLAIASQTFREAPKGEKSAFVARLHALAGAHDVLTEKNWESVSVVEILTRALSPFQEQGKERFVLRGPDVTMRANNAVLLAMIIHELGTNAVKYGALSSEGGRVSLSWLSEKDRSRLCLTWREIGGPLVRPPQRFGFGSQMIKRALQGEEGAASIDFRPEGVVSAIELAI